MSQANIERALRYGEQLCREAERFQRRVGGAQYLANEGREIPDHLAEAISEGYRELSSDIYYFRKHAAQVDPEAQAAEIARLSAALDETLAQLEAERARNAEPVAWMLEWTFNGEERGQRLYDDERHCIFDAESDGGVVVPLLRGEPLTTTQVLAIIPGAEP